MHLARDPEMTAERTLRPLRRLSFDAAIPFSEISVVPDALKGDGPRLGAIQGPEVHPRFELMRRDVCFALRCGGQRDS
jgi:uroporphyrinogen-III decarboxylase